MMLLVVFILGIIMGCSAQNIRNCTVENYPTEQCLRMCYRNDYRADNCFECWKEAVVDEDGDQDVNCWPYCLEKGPAEGLRLCDEQRDRLKKKEEIKKLIAGLSIGLGIPTLCFCCWLYAHCSERMPVYGEELSKWWARKKQEYLEKKKQNLQEKIIVLKGELEALEAQERPV